MIFNRKTIFIGLFCMALFLGFSGVAMAQTPEEEPAVPPLVLTDLDKDIMNFIRNTAAEDWTDGMFDDSSIEYEPEFGGLIVAGEVPIYIVKSRISCNLPMRETKIKENKETIDVAIFMPRVINGEIAKVREVTFWRHKESGLLVASQVIVR